MKQKIQVAICEDDRTQLAYIQSLVAGWAETEEIFCQVDGFISAEQ